MDLVYDLFNQKQPGSLTLMRWLSIKNQLEISSEHLQLEIWSSFLK